MLEDEYDTVEDEDDTVIQTKLFISKGTLSCFVLFFLLELVVFWEKKKKKVSL